MTDCGTDYYGIDWGQVHQAQAELIAKQKNAEADAAALAQRIKWGLATTQPWAEKDAEAANRAMRRSANRDRR